MRIRPLTLAMTVCLGGAPGALAQETLEVLITTPEGEEYRSLQELGAAFDAYDSGAIIGPVNLREYSAIRCDSAWGAIKYRIPLASGPGYRLQADGDVLRLQLMQHSVVSEDVNIAAMEVHCLDSAPKPVMSALGEVTLERGSPESQRVQLANGYLVEFRYDPTGNDPALVSKKEQKEIPSQLSQQADSSTDEDNEEG